MKTITKQFKVYKYMELSREAQETARTRWENNYGGHQWFRADEYIDSLKALAEAFGGEIKDYQLDWESGYNSYVRFEMPKMSSGGILKKLLTLGGYNKRTLKGLGDCELTGTCYDESALDGFRLAIMRHGATLDEAMQAAFKTWIESAQYDYAYDFGEGMAEMCEANGYEFLEDGTMYTEGK